MVMSTDSSPVPSAYEDALLDGDGDGRRGCRQRRRIGLQTQMPHDARTPRWSRRRANSLVPAHQLCRRAANWIRRGGVVDLGRAQLPSAPGPLPGAARRLSTTISCAPSASRKAGGVDQGTSECQAGPCGTVVESISE